MNFSAQQVMPATLVASGTRFSGAEWADMLRYILIIGVGGIGSWAAINLAQIGHSLVLLDGDVVDETNVRGGQAYMINQVGHRKVHAVTETCRSKGASNTIIPVPVNFEEGSALDSLIVITGLDAMLPRRHVYEEWKKRVSGEVSTQAVKEAILIDGRLTMEMYEIIAVRPIPEQMDAYEKQFLFSDEEAQELDCTTKQSTFAAMGIAAEITATLCNHLTNVKLGLNVRDVPFYQRKHYPGMVQTCRDEKFSLCETT